LTYALESEFSTPDTGWEKLTPPTNITATDGTYTDKVRVTWSASSGATEYKIYRNTTDNNMTSSQIGTSTSSPYDDTSADNDTSYYYWVKAHATLGDSDFSNADTGWQKGDDNILEAGAFWVSNYDHHDDLPETDEDAQIFLDVLEDSSYYPAFNIGDSTPVSESLFNDSANPQNSPDGVDIFWFDGHGANGDLVLIHDWTTFIPIYDRVHGEDLLWGDSDLEWAFMHACETLMSDKAETNSYLKSNGKFAKALNGIHMICGADTIMAIPYNTQPVAEFLTGTGGRELKTVKEAWFQGIDVNEDVYWDSDSQSFETVKLRIIAEDDSYENEYIFGKGTGPAPDTTIDEYYVSWDYPCS
jgi:hypothetical protein